MANPVIIPQKAAGMGIVVDSGGFVMTNFNAYLLLRLHNSPQSQPIVRQLTVAQDGKTGEYVTTGTDFPVAGIYDAQLKVQSGSVVLYSAEFDSAVWIQPVLAA